MGNLKLRWALTFVVSTAMVAVSSMAVMADVVKLQNGRQLSGELSQLEGETFTLTTDGNDQPAEIAWADVEYVSLQQTDCLHTAGERLSNFRSKFYIGWGLSALGTILTFLSFDFSDPTNFQFNPILSLVGGLFSLGGAILQLISYWDIGSAGEALMEC